MSSYFHMLPTRISSYVSLVLTLHFRAGLPLHSQKWASIMHDLAHLSGGPEFITKPQLPLDFYLQPLTDDNAIFFLLADPVLQMAYVLFWGASVTGTLVYVYFHGREFVDSPLLIHTAEKDDSEHS